MVDLPSSLPSPQQLFFQRWVSKVSPSAGSPAPQSVSPPLSERLAVSAPFHTGRAIAQLQLVSPAPSTKTLPLPSRSPLAPSGSQFWKSVQALDFHAREQAIQAQILAGNLPDHLRNYREVPLEITQRNGERITGSIQALPDYLAIGSNDDYVLVPMTPLSAQAIASATGTLLPTRKIVNQLYQAAEIKLPPRPKTPGAVMQSTRYYQEHDQTIRQQRLEARAQAGQLIAGHKKDVVISNLLDQKSQRVAIYGWHQPNGKPIQPLSTIHEDTYADYSHGVRLIAPTMTVNGIERSVAEVLRDPRLAPLISDEGVIRNASAARR